MTELILIRHGETAWNTVRRLQGHIDIPLNEVGERQARALGAALSAVKIDAIISSDLGRAQQTARAIADWHDLPIHSDASLRERCFGVFEGLLYSELAERYPEEYVLWQARDPDVVLPTGQRPAESIRSFQVRIITSLTHYARKHPKQRIVVVGHGGVLECAYRAARQLPLHAQREVKMLNASINRFQFSESEHGEPHWQLLEWGNIEHLKENAMDEIA